MEYNIYCDESCHLWHDHSDIMVLGAIRCSSSFAKSFNRDILEIKKRYGFNPHNEIKWTKVSPANIDYFLELIDYFFDNPKLNFRGYIARGKSELSLDSQYEYNTWYYKMYYRMLEYFLDQNPASSNNIYIDIKDTIGFEKVNRLKDYLNSHYHSLIIPKAQLVDSSDIALLQLADLFIGALAYKHRGLNTSMAKLEIIKRIETRNDSNVLCTVPYQNHKANWFIWCPDTWR